MTLSILFLLLFTLKCTIAVPLQQRDDASGHHKVTKKLKDFTNINEDEGLELFEGDIDLTPENYVETNDEERSDEKRSSVRDLRHLWVERKVPYIISPDLDNITTLILACLQDFSNNTCLEFVQRTDEKYWINFNSGVGCHSSVGRQFLSPDLGQSITLSKGCEQKPIIMHELLHALGLWHEQSRFDRNENVEVLWENVQDGKEHNFKKYSHEIIDDLGVDYDERSLLHYSRTAFSKNGNPTIRDIINPDKVIGESQAPTALDWIKLNALYKCTDDTGGWSGWSTYSRCNKACIKSRQRFCFAEDKTSLCPEADQHGIHTQRKTCPDEECYAPINGCWSRWSPWDICSVDCGEGTRTRTRLCDDPIPENGGAECVGNNTETETCSGACSQGDDCTFLYHTCTWSQDVNDEFDWTRNSAATPTKNTGPVGGNSGKSQDYYLFTEASSPRMSGDKARLLSRVITGLDEKRCLIFFYHMYGLYMGSLNVYYKPQTNDPETLMWSRTGNQGFFWYKAKIEFTAKDDFQLVIEGVRGPSYTSDVAIDDVRILWGSCADPQEGPPADSLPLPKVLKVCDFQLGLCDWSNQASGDELDWIKQAGPTPSTGTGPKTDHTYRSGNGKYLFIESSSPSLPGNRARLVSGNLQSNFKCLTFWYHMYGINTGQLNIYKKGAVAEDAIWKLNGNQGNEWGQASVKIDVTSNDKVIIEAVRGNGYKGDIAIDDVKFTDGNRCTSVPVVAQSSANCDFEFDTCFWKNLATSDFIWTRGLSKTPTSGTGPSGDHTSGTGFYMFIETSSPRQKGDKAALMSLEIAKGAHCISLWYNMYGSSVGSLEVSKMTNVTTSIFFKQGNQGTGWKNAEITVTETKLFRLIIEATRGDSWTGDIAIDDITVTNGKCS